MLLTFWIRLIHSEQVRFNWEVIIPQKHRYINEFTNKIIFSYDKC